MGNILATWSEAPAEVSLLLSPRNWSSLFLDGISKRWFPGPWERHSLIWVIKLMRGFFSLKKDLHTFWRDRERSYNYKFPKINDLRQRKGRVLFAFSITLIKPLTFNFYLSLRITGPSYEKGSGGFVRANSSDLNFEPMTWNWSL